MAGLDLAILGGKSMHDDDHADASYGHDDAEPNHEFESAAADAFHAAKSDDMVAFKKALYNACCAVFDEHSGSDDDSDEG